MILGIQAAAGAGSFGSQKGSFAFLKCELNGESTLSKVGECGLVDLKKGSLGKLT